MRKTIICYYRATAAARQQQADVITYCCSAASMTLSTPDPDFKVIFQNWTSKRSKLEPRLLLINRISHTNQHRMVSFPVTLNDPQHRFQGNDTFHRQISQNCAFLYCPTPDISFILNIGDSLVSLGDSGVSCLHNFCTSVRLFFRDLQLKVQRRLSCVDIRQKRNVNWQLLQ